MRRHPFRGLLAGFLVGLGISVLLMVYGQAPLGEWTVIAVLVVGLLLGLAAAWVLPARRVRTVGATTTTEV